MLFFYVLQLNSIGFHGANHASNTAVTECLNSYNDFLNIRV